MKLAWIAAVGLSLGCANGGAGKVTAPANAAPGSQSGAKHEQPEELDLTKLFGAECAAPAARLAELAQGPMERVSEEQRARYLLDCANAGRLTPELRNSARPALLARGRALLQQLETTRPTPGVAWRWQEPYVDARAEAEVLLDLFGFIGRADDVQALLRRAESLPDPLLKLWAGTSLLRLGQGLASGSAIAIAADPETRNVFFDKLAELHRPELFPAAERKQAKFAESDMVRWLTFPTELGRAPDHIELMKAIDRDLGPNDGIGTAYLFRFKTDPPDHFAKDGWMAGVSGPFLKKDGPTTDAHGGTFSTFAAWDSATAEEHVQAVEDLLEQFHAERAAASHE